MRNGAGIRVEEESSALGLNLQDASGMLAEPDRSAEGRVSVPELIDGNFQEGCVEGKF